MLVVKSTQKKPSLAAAFEVRKLLILASRDRFSVSDMHLRLFGLQSIGFEMKGNC
jgi:hypothetical protein